MIFRTDPWGQRVYLPAFPNINQPFIVGENTNAMDSLYGIYIVNWFTSPTCCEYTIVPWLIVILFFHIGKIYFLVRNGMGNYTHRKQRNPPSNAKSWRFQPCNIECSNCSLGGWWQFRLGRLRIPFGRIGGTLGKIRGITTPTRKNPMKLDFFWRKKEWMEGGGFFRNQAGWMDGKWEPPAIKSWNMFRSDIASY